MDIYIWWLIRSKAPARFAAGVERRSHVFAAAKTDEPGSRKSASVDEQIICDQPHTWYDFLMTHTLIRHTDITITARDGFPLKAILYEPADQPIKSVIQINPGWGLHQFIYANFAKYFVDQGYAVLTFDYRGIGKSIIPFDWIKSFDARMSDHGVLDMPAVFDWLSGRYPDKQKIILGHSLGGQIIGLMDNCEKIDRIYTIGSAIGYFKTLNKPMNLLLPHLFFKIVPFYSWIYKHSGIFKPVLSRYLGITAASVTEWKEWCSGPDYFKPYLGKSISKHYFENIHAPLISIRVEDDPYANDVTTPLLLSNYPNAKIKIIKITLKESGERKIGHTGFFRKKHKKIWKVILDDLEAGLSE